MLIKKLLFTVFCLCFSYSAWAQGIKFFEGSFSEAKAEAKKQNKYLFIDCWENGCWPCIKMEKEIMPQKEVGDFYNAHFINLKMNMYKGEGIELKKKYEVTAYPTFLYLDPDGEVAHYVTGSCKAFYFIKDAKTALNDTNNMKGMVRRFERGERDTSFLKKLIETTNAGDRDICEKALSIYWDLIPEVDLFKVVNYRLFKYNEQDINAKAYKYVFVHQDEFLEKFVSKKDYSNDTLHARILLENDSDLLYLKAARAELPAAQGKNFVLYEKAKAIALQAKYREGKYEACIYQLTYCKMTNDWKDFFSDLDKYLNLEGPKRPYIYDNFAYAIDTSTNNREVIEKAKSYSEKCISYGKNPDNMNTYAHILYKLEKYKEAIAAADESISLAVSYNANHDEADELLDQIKNTLEGKN